MANGNDKSSLGKINDDFIAYDYTDQHKPIKKRDRYVSKRKIKDILKQNTPKSSIRPHVEQNLGPDASEGSPDTGPWDEHHEQNALENLQNLSDEQFSKINKEMHHSLTKSISKKNK